MNDIKLEQVRGWLKRPAALFGLTAAAVLLTLILLYARLVLPAQLDAAESRRELAQLEEQKRLLAASPEPAKLEPGRLGALEAALPARPELAAFLVDMRAMETASGVAVEALAEDAGDGGLDPLEAALNQAAGGAPPADAALGDAAAIGGASSGGTAADSAAGASAQQPGSGSPPYRTVTYTVTAHGEYDGLIDFMDRLGKGAREVRIGAWSVTATGGSGNAAAPNNAAAGTELTTATAGNEPYTLVVSVTLYYAEQFRNISSGEEAAQ